MQTDWGFFSANCSNKNSKTDLMRILLFFFFCLYKTFVFCKEYHLLKVWKEVWKRASLYIFCYYDPGTQIISAQATEFYRLLFTCLC